MTKFWEKIKVALKLLGELWRNRHLLNERRLPTALGRVVEPTQVLMELVPLGERLEVEAFVSNQDIGYVRAGQRAEVKIATFPFTKYGVIEATVDQVAEDATVDEKLGLIYRTRLLLAKNSLRVNGRETPLLPPLLRMKDESLRER